MILKALKYTRFEGEPRQWKIVGKGENVNNGFATFDNLNLLVGKNASGKSRTLSIIREIADLLAGRTTVAHAAYPSEKYELVFGDELSEYCYCIDYKSKIIINESLSYNKKEILNRQKKILHDKPLIIEDETIPAVGLKDADGNYYFEALVEWGKNLKKFIFANQHEKNNWVKDYTIIERNEQDVDNAGLLIYNFNKGVEQFGDAFIDDIIKCMSQMGYSISDIQLQNSKYGYSLIVEEDGLYKISQREMSQGMFRALSLFIQLTYACMSNRSLCILFDDMGEGLDYDRSKDIINIVTKKVNRSNIQFFMTSNDRNIMNKIPLRYWTIIDRYRDESIFYNYGNSKDIYDDFSYTGLNNFDFLATDFYKKGFGSDDDEIDTETED